MISEWLTGKSQPKPQPKPDPNRYPVFPGTTPEESETDDTLDEIDDIEGDDL